MRPRSAKGRNRAERAPTTTRAAPLATAPHSALALARRDRRMPFGGPGAEARGEAIEELRSQRDFRQQDERLTARAQRRGDRLEIDLRLARAGDAFEQDRAERARLDRARQRVGGGALIGLQRSAARNRRSSGAAAGSGGSATISSAPSSTRPSITPRTAGGGLRERRLGQRRAIGEGREHARARRREAKRRLAGRAIGEARRRRGRRLGRARRHAQHHAARRQGPARHPVDEIAQRLAQRREIADFGDRLEIVAAALRASTTRRRRRGAFPAARRRIVPASGPMRRARDSCRRCRPRPARARRRRRFAWGL